MSKVIKRGPGAPATRRPKIVLALRTQSRQTAAELGVATAYMIQLSGQEKPLVEVAGSRQSGKRGRPANEYKLTKAGQAVATNLVKKAKAQPVAA